ncbi:MAG: ribosomal protein S18-alanine N-acetyltransferase [Deltaproteobacteria bacterium]|nr:ribosomal protein S18-alanine N-acetyltransferase [Deltaproteobacteria bacterium]
MSIEGAGPICDLSKAKEPDGAWTIRPATLDDVDAILSIERASFTEPWPRSAFLSEIDGRQWSRVPLLYHRDVLIGFMVHWIIATELHLLNLAVDSTWRRRGAAHRLVEYLVNSARRDKCTEVLLEVRISNEGARKLYRGFGFESVGIRPGYYPDNGEDALLMSLQLDTPRSERLPERL